jgi:uracil phosphoribosyltransferase
MPLQHRYGDDVTILDDPCMRSLLARIGSPDTPIQSLPQLVRTAYVRLCHEVLAREFPTVEQQVPSRMITTEPRAVVRERLLCPRTELVLCAVIRAGILPTQACYEAAGELIPPRNVRIDFVNVSRTVDSRGQVTGARLDGCKIGGPVDGTLVLIPDPMGATGSTVARTVEVYRGMDEGPPLAIVALHLMVTPEAILSAREACPGVKIYAGRLDRGLSDDDVLRTVPGTFPDRERGLDDRQYIVPGAGGMGELLTNSWV